MKAAVAQQPIATSIDAASMSFYNYSEGIFDDPKCGTSLNHATLIVGYGAAAAPVCTTVYEDECTTVNY